MRVVLLPILALLALSACVAVPPPSKSPSSLSRSVKEEPQCTIGAPRVIHGDEFRIDVLTVLENSRALERVSGGRTAAEFGMEIYADVKNGLVPRFDGQTTVTISVIGVRTSLAPRQVPYLSGMDRTGSSTKDGICRGYASVRVVGNRVEVTVPVIGGAEHLAQASVIFPRNMFEGIPDSLPCVTWGVPVYAPELTRGPMQGASNTLCGIPGTKAGHTQFGQRVQEGVRWTLFSGIVKR